MAKYEYLPLYKQSYSLLLEFHKLVPTFPKKYKFSLGGGVITDLTQGVILIIQINSKKYLNLIDTLNINYVIVNQLANELSSGLKERQENKFISNKNDIIFGSFQIESEDKLDLSSKISNKNSLNDLISSLLNDFKELEKKLKKLKNEKK